MAEAQQTICDVLGLKPFINRVQVAFIVHNLEETLIQILPDGKDIEKAEKFNYRGKNRFLEGRTLLAIKNYTRAIKYAVDNTLAMGEAHFGRGEALMELDLISEASSEFTVARQNPCSGYVTARLRENELFWFHKAEDQLELRPVRLPEIAEDNKNERIQCASKDVEIRESPEHGRRIVAARDIPMGEIIAVENPYAWVLYPVDNTYYCAECCVPCLWLKPCPKCTEIMFCSIDCRDRSIEKYHKYECGILKTIKKNFSTNIFIAARLVLKNIEVLTTPEAFVPRNNTYRSDRFLEILNLRTGNPNKDTTLNEMYATETAKLFKLLDKNSELFNSLPEDSKEMFKGLVMKLAIISHVHFIDIKSIILEEGSEDREVARGAYSFMGLINHSCAPNIVMHDVGKTMVVMTIKDVRKGDEICRSYDDFDSYYAEQRKTVRQECLWRNFQFRCTCEACENDWPDMDNVQVCEDDVVHQKLTEIRDNLHDCFGNKEILGNIFKELKALPRHWPTPSCEQMRLEYYTIMSSVPSCGIPIWLS